MLARLSLVGQTTLMSWNIRYDNPEDGDNRWKLRREEVAGLIRTYRPDILGVQEGLYAQVEFLDTVLTGYDYTGVGREDGYRQGEFAAILYHKERVQLLDSRTWWLSDTPDTVSVGWDAALERIVTYGKFFALSTGDTFYVFNTHFDHIGQVARERSAELILQIIDGMGIMEKKIVVMGDLNAGPEERPVAILSSRLEDPRRMNGILRSGPEGTFNAFKQDATLESRIDYIFVKNLVPKVFQHIPERRSNGLWPSDHLPVLVRLE
ncbi:MAG TPA: endonuclease/exonuclease/phosphatase family protein [Bacteroidales bacterium]|nr:endonuclease/exonuclease/phosphatase family protein [Bacteroidales bacterium]HRZ76932.1 endonuclease/exonuclease/phosphatase family protein [Bacteroidales bacterium]